MDILKAYRFRIYPTFEQEQLFDRTVGVCRFVYNLCLEQRKLEYHRSDPRKISAYNQINELPVLKEELPWLKEVPSQVIQQSVIDLDKAFKNFFDGRADYPKFRKRGDRDSFRYPDAKQFKIERDRIFLPKAGWVKMVGHREIIGKPKNATVSREADWWYVSIQCEVEIADPVVPVGVPVGVDLGIARPITLSTDEPIFIPRTSPKERRKLANLQRTIARRQKGSRNRRKAVRCMARYRARLRRQRNDAVHKATTRIAKNHSSIIVEDLRVKNMTASAAGTIEEPGRNVAAKSGLNRSLLDVAPGQIRNMLEYKARWYGSTVIAVNPAYTSQTCNRCGQIDAHSRLSQSEFCCVACGHVDNADLNAAKNILTKGLTGGLPGRACGSNRGAGRKQERGVVKRTRSSALQGRE